jgi:hypothetical protein
MSTVPDLGGERRQRLAALRPALLRRSHELVATLAPALRHIGDNQWRTLTAACQEAVVVDEIRALLQYKVGKDRGSGQHGQPGGWATPIGGKAAGQICVEAVDEVARLAEEAGADEAMKMEALALFFGYVTWAVVAQRQPEGSDRG